MSEPLPKEEKTRDKAEQAAPNAERVGLWRILAISVAAAVVALVVVVFAM